jgi:hypothetical protein
MLPAEKRPTDAAAKRVTDADIATFVAFRPVVDCWLLSILLSQIDDDNL